MSSLFLQTALEAVKNAEDVILKYFDGDVKAELKADESPVTIADKQAEEIIVKTISVKFPDHTFFGEEGEKSDLSNHKGYTWIIDPIDGTKAFIRNSPIFATQLALLHDGELILGVSNAPVLKELMYAEKGQGAICNGEKLKVSEIGNLSEAYISHGSLKYFAELGKVDNLVAVAAAAKQSRGFGDFWAYHLIAQNRLDVMLEAKIKFWDIAAMKVILEEAGGKITQLDGGIIDPGSITALATNSVLHDAVLRLFNE